MSRMGALGHASGAACRDGRAFLAGETPDIPTRWADSFERWAHDPHKTNGMSIFVERL